MKEIVIALITLAGTIIAGLFAYLQFRKGHTTALRQKQAEHVQEIYKSVWDMTEDMAFKLREEYDFTGEVALDQQIRKINEFLLKNQLFIPVRINGKVATYVRASRELATRLNLPEYRDIWKSWHISTAFEEREIQPAEAELKRLVKSWRAARETLLQELREPFSS